MKLFRTFFEDNETIGDIDIYAVPPDRDPQQLGQVNEPGLQTISKFIYKTIIKTEFIKGIIFKKNDHRYLPLIAINKGATKIREIVVSHRERKYGVTKYNNLHKIFFGIIETVSFLIRIKLGYYNSIKSRIKKETK